MLRFNWRSLYVDRAGSSKKIKKSKSELVDLDSANHVGVSWAPLFSHSHVLLDN